jgi:hypothetical protein
MRVANRRDAPEFAAKSVFSACPSPQAPVELLAKAQYQDWRSGLVFKRAMQRDSGRN